VSASVLTANLFESIPDVCPSHESMAEGAVLLRGLAKPVEADLLVVPVATSQNGDSSLPSNISWLTDVIPCNLWVIR